MKYIIDTKTMPHSMKEVEILPSEFDAVLIRLERKSKMLRIFCASCKRQEKVNRVWKQVEASEESRNRNVASHHTCPACAAMTRIERMIDKRLQVAA